VRYLVSAFEYSVDVYPVPYEEWAPDMDGARAIMARIRPLLRPGDVVTLTDVETDEELEHVTGGKGSA
jgi:hypothetical protein